MVGDGKMQSRAWRKGRVDTGAHLDKGADQLGEGLHVGESVLL